MESRRDVLDVGAVLGETYRIQALIGRGGMGAVWAAEHLRLPGKHVAVKVLLDATAGGDEMLQRFRREAEIASRLGHPNIVEVLDFNTLPTGQPYIVLEYLVGETLASRLMKGRIPLDETLAITRQVGSALQAAHRAGVVHRDLKPDNVFLCTPEEDVPTRVKVLDFGISKIRGSKSLRTQDAILMGTPQYMSPEQATGKNTELDGRTDVFALGAIVYEMLGGQPAFAGGSLAEVVYRVVHGQPTPLVELAPALPPNVLAAVERALQKDPAARPPDVGQFILELTGRPLHSFHTGQPVGLEATRLTPQAASASAMDATHTPRPGGASTSPWSASARQSFDAAARSSALTAPPAPPPRPAWPIVLASGIALMAGAIALGQWLAGRQAPQRTAANEPLEPLKQIQAPPPPPSLAVSPPPAVAPPPPMPPLVAQAEPPPARSTQPEHPARKEPLRKRLLKKAAPEPPPIEPAKGTQVAQAPSPPPVPPATPGDSIRPETRKLLDQAEEALNKNRPLDAARLVDQSFFIQKTSLGYAIQARAACQRRDVGAARAAIRNVIDPALRRTAVQDCLRQDVWLF